MLFILVLIAWLTMQYWGGAAMFQRDEYFLSWHQWFDSKYRDNVGDTAASIVVLILPVFLLALLLHWFGGWFFGLLGVLINVAVLLYACGRGDYIARIEAYRQSLDASDNTQAFSAANQQFDIQHSHLGGLHRQVRELISYQSYERWFPVAFWFLLLGAPGALLYRLCHIIRDDATAELQWGDVGTDGTEDTAVESENIYQENANIIMGFMDWLPARLWALTYAICGDYNAIIQVLHKRCFERVSSQQLLLEVNLASIYGAAESASLGESEQLDSSAVKSQLDAMQMMGSRAMVLLLGAIAFIAIVI